MLILFAYIMLGMAGAGDVGGRAGLSGAKLRLAVPFSVVLCRFQLSFEFLNIDVQWPQFLLDMLKYFRLTLNFDFGKLMSPVCLMQFASPGDAFLTQHYFLAALLPIMAGSVFALKLVGGIFSKKYVHQSASYKKNSHTSA